jgi:hypothetical protein
VKARGREVARVRADVDRQALEARGSKTDGDVQSCDSKQCLLAYRPEREFRARERCEATAHHSAPLNWEITARQGN